MPVITPVLAEGRRPAKRRPRPSRWIGPSVPGKPETLTEGHAQAGYPIAIW